MTPALPNFVEFHEEGPREGFQIEKYLYPLDARAALIDALAASGLKQIQVASFVNPRAVPAMADAEALFAAIERRDGVRYTALWLNERGFARARAAPGVDLDGKLVLYVSDGFSRHNNNATAAEMRARQRGWIDLYDRCGVALEAAYILPAFGCIFDGPIPLSMIAEATRFLVDLCAETGHDLPHIMLADTMGWANPDTVKRVVGAVREIVPETRVGLHLHDTRGIGAANVLAALEIGVDLFDSSVAGLGGCPFAGQGARVAAGNICTEDMVFLCHELGIATGINLDALIAAARLAERIIGRPLTGKIMHAGPPETPTPGDA